MQNPAYTAHLQAQMTAVFEAIADGRKAPRAYPQPRKTDYDTLAGDLTKRGWSQGDMQLFSDERALRGRGPKRCASWCTTGSRRSWTQGPRHAAAIACGFLEAGRRRLKFA